MRRPFSLCIILWIGSPMSICLAERIFRIYQYGKSVIPVENIYFLSSKDSFSILFDKRSLPVYVRFPKTIRSDFLDRAPRIHLRKGNGISANGPYDAAHISDTEFHLIKKDRCYGFRNDSECQWYIHSIHIDTLDQTGPVSGYPGNSLPIVIASDKNADGQLEQDETYSMILIFEK